MTVLWRATAAVICAAIVPSSASSQDQLDFARWFAAWWLRRGRRLAADGPEFQQLMADAAERRFDVVLVFHTSRFARNQVEARRYKALLRERLGIRVVGSLPWGYVRDKETGGVVSDLDRAQGVRPLLPGRDRSGGSKAGATGLRPTCGTGLRFGGERFAASCQRRVGGHNACAVERQAPTRNTRAMPQPRPIRVVISWYTQVY